MPRPLSELTPDEQHLYGALAADPLNAFTPRALADAVEEQGQQHRTDLLRQQTRLPLLELLHGASLTEEESARVATRIHTLLQNPAAEQQPAQAADVERELSAALGSPQHGESMLHLLDKDGTLDAQHLQEQYDFQVTLLASLDLLEDQNGHFGIAGIDHRFHPLPSLQDVQARLENPALRQKISQGFNQFLLVPFALPLQRLIEAWKRDIVRNQQQMQAHGGLNRKQPVWAWDDYKREDLVYSPRHFAPDHGGRTKAQLLAADPSAGWQVLLTEGALTDLPRAGAGKTVAGRRQIEAGLTRHQYLTDCPKDEVGWTPETYIAAFLTALERTGRPLDLETYSYLTGSYLPASGYVPAAYWASLHRQAFLGGGSPDYSDPDDGARAAVRAV